MMDIHHELIGPTLRTTSRVVAEKFGKLHKNVLRDIEKLMADTPEDFNRLNFEPVDYLDAKGERRPMVEMTRDGFTLLAMGFTGAPAMAWKLRFIEAFNLMEAELRARPAGDGTLPEVFGGDLTTRDKLNLIRETRLLHGVTAGRRMWAMLAMPDVSGRGEAAVQIGDAASGRACVGYLLGLDAGGRQVAAWVADGQDDPRLARLGLRVRDDGLFVANGTTIFAGSRWAGGAHRLALMALDGVHVLANPLTLAGTPARGLVLPFGVLAEGDHV